MRSDYGPQGLAKNPQFIKRGDFSRKTCIWHDAKDGYLITDVRGVSFNGVRYIAVNHLDRMPRESAP